MPPVKPPFGTPLNRAHPLAQGLVGCWLFNEGSGNKAYDSSGCENHGILANFADPATATSGWVPGPHGGAMAFDGSNDFINCGNSPMLSYSNFTWILYSQFNSKNSWLFTKNILGISDMEYGLVFSASPAAVVYINGISAATSSVLERNLPNVHQLAITFNGEKIIFYVDGKYFSENVYSISPVPTSATLQFSGRRPAVSSPTNIILSAWSMYSRALSPEEISYLAAFPYCMYEQDDAIFSKPFNQNYYRQLLAGGY